MLMVMTKEMGQQHWESDGEKRKEKTLIHLCSLWTSSQSGI